MITDPSSHDGHMITDSLSRDSDSFVNEMVYVVDRRGHLLCSHTRGLFTVEQVCPCDYVLLIILLR